MSGPKKSKWEIRQERIEASKKEAQRRHEAYLQRIEEKKQIRASKEQEIHNALRQTEQYLEHLISLGLDNPQRIREWIDDVDVYGDLRECWRQINGINSYLKQKEPHLIAQKQALAKAEAKKQIAQEEARIKEAKISVITEGLRATQEEFKEIINDAIKQRVEMFIGSITANPDNPNTLKQIETFKHQLHTQYQAYQSQREDIRFVAEEFSAILGGGIDEGKDGGFSIFGAIDGVPISVKLDPKTKDIDMDTPTDGGCSKALSTLQQQLKDANIVLGPIKVVRTGQTLNQTITQNTTTRTKA